MRYRIDQRDEIDGGWMSPHYEVTPNPSIVFTAPGVPDENFAKSANFMGKFSRMNPIAAREIRDHMYGRKNNYKEFVAESEMFSFVSSTAISLDSSPPSPFFHICKSLSRSAPCSPSYSTL